MGVDLNRFRGADQEAVARAARDGDSPVDRRSVLGFRVVLARPLP